MKKIGINLIIGTIISVVLIVICLLVIKPNYSYFMMDENHNIWASTNGSTYSYENEIISYTKEGKKITIEMNNSYSNNQDARIMYFTELEARYDARQSFYGKAHVIDHENGTYELQSYNTIVAKIVDGKVVQNDIGKYSMTTNRHIREFIKQYARG